MSNTRAVVVPSIPANGTSPIWNSATQEYENQVLGGSVHAVQLAGTSINAVATNLDTDLEANSVYIFQIDLVGKRTVPSASNAARTSILQVVTGPSSITSISTEFILTEDPSLFNGWSIAFSNPAGLTFRTALTSLVTETVGFVESIRQVKNPAFNLPPPLSGSYVPTTRQIIAGRGISVNGGGSASLVGDVTIAAVLPPVAIAALDIDWSLGDVFSKTLAAGPSTFTFSNVVDGQVIVVEVTGAASTLTWPVVKWPGGTPPTQTTSGTDIYTFIKRGSNIFGSVVQAMA